MQKITRLTITAVAVLIIVVVVLNGNYKSAEIGMQQIKNQVAEDAVKQYEIAKKNGSAIDAYSAASMVCAAYLQAKDEANYAKWKAIEKEEAKRAGMPEM